MADDGFHDFQSRRWLQPLTKPQRGRWTGETGGAFLGDPILDETGAPILDEAGQGNRIYADHGGTAIPKNVPALLAAPIITGIPTQGQLLMATTGQWSNSPFIYYFQWLRDGVPISGQTINAYTLTSSDVGHEISIQVITSNNIGNSSPGFSRAVGPIAATFGASATPVTSGTVGTVYTGFTVATSGGWAPYTFNLITGYWPTGITMSGETGVVAGTPTQNGTFANITIQVTDRYGQTVNLAPFSVTIGGGGGGPALIFGPPGNTGYLGII